MLIFSTLVLIRHLWQLKTVVCLHWCLIRAFLLSNCNKRVLVYHTSVKRFVVHAKVCIFKFFSSNFFSDSINWSTPQTSKSCMQLFPGFQRSQTKKFENLKSPIKNAKTKNFFALGRIFCTVKNNLAKTLQLTETTTG